MSAMNALIFTTMLAGTTRMGVSAAAIVWLFLVTVEWLADSFAGSLLHGWAAYLSALRMQAAVHEISAKRIEREFWEGHARVNAWDNAQNTL
jgi:hypothetical protein